MRYMLSAAHLHQNDIQKGSMDTPVVLPSPPLPPKRFCSSEGRLTNTINTTFMSTEFIGKSKKTDNKICSCPELNALSTRQLMRKSVAAIMVHAGFESASESALNTFTDIAIEHYGKFCKILKDNLEHKSPNFNPVDVLGEVLLECSSSSLSSLQEYWLKGVKNVALELEKEDLSLLSEYNSLKDSMNKTAVKEEVA